MRPEANTIFQKRLIEDKDTCWEIVKLFHPDIPETVNGNTKTYITKDKMLIYPHYDWVVIEFRIRGYGFIHICISNSQQNKLYGGRITKENMSQALSDGTVYFDIWRIVNDKLYTDRNDDIEVKNKAIEILKSLNYSLQSVDEMFSIYYSD